MWTRRELKTKGMESFRANRWKCILMGLIFSLAGGGTFTFFFSPTESGGGEAPGPFTTVFGHEIQSAVQPLPRSVFLIMLVLFAVALIAGLVVTIAILFPVELGVDRFFVMNLNSRAEVREIGYGFDYNYKNVVHVMFLYHIKMILWTLLLIIPGIVKSYEYRMVPYLLAEHPDMDAKQIFARSRAMMTGQKWNTFVLDLSFIGWHLLGLVTFGIVELFYTMPYYQMTSAALYERLMYGENDV